jgi:hypothetical protein
MKTRHKDELLLWYSSDHLWTNRDNPAKAWSNRDIIPCFAMHFAGITAYASFLILIDVIYTHYFPP